MMARSEVFFLHRQCSKTTLPSKSERLILGGLDPAEPRVPLSYILQQIKGLYAEERTQGHLDSLNPHGNENCRFPPVLRHEMRKRAFQGLARHPKTTLFFWLMKFGMGRKHWFSDTPLTSPSLLFPGSPSALAASFAFSGTYFALT